MRSWLFESNNAKYYQVYGHHGSLNINDIPIIGKEFNKMPKIKKYLEKLLDYLNQKNLVIKEDIFSKNNIKDLDAIVVEETPKSYLGIDSLNNFNISNVLKNIKETKSIIPFYLPDVSLGDDSSRRFVLASILGLSTIGISSLAEGILAYKMEKAETLLQKKTSRRNFLKMSCAHSASCLLGLYLLGGHFYAPYHLAFNKGKADKVTPKLIYFHTELFSTKVINLRNAIIAKKIDEVIAPIIRKKKAKSKLINKKPTIAIIAGVQHAGMLEYLKDEKKRNKILGRYEDDIFQLYKDELKIREARKLNKFTSKQYVNNLDSILELTPYFTNFNEMKWKEKLIYRPNLFI